MARDNWGDPATFACVTCQWFVWKDGAPVGRCRRHAPELGGFPAVYPSDWCGDHKLGGATPAAEVEMGRKKGGGKGKGGGC